MELGTLQPARDPQGLRPSAQGEGSIRRLQLPCTIFSLKGGGEPWVPRGVLGGRGRRRESEGSSTRLASSGSWGLGADSAGNSMARPQEVQPSVTVGPGSPLPGTRPEEHRADARGSVSTPTRHPPPTWPRAGSNPSAHRIRTAPALKSPRSAAFPRPCKWKGILARG